MTIPIPKLKPCPFCGKEVFLSRSYSRYAILHECEVVNVVLGWGRKDELIEKWNKPLNACTMFVDYEKSCPALKQWKKENP